MAWLYLHAGRVADIDAILAEAGPAREVGAAQYAMAVVRDEPSLVHSNSLGEFTGGPMDALVLRTHFDLGRLPELTSAPSSPWAVKATESWQVSALLAAGHTEQAFELYHALVDASDQSVWLSGLVGPRLMYEIGDRDEAWRLLHEGRRQIVATGSVMFEAYSLLIEAEFELRLHDDPAAARAILDQAGQPPGGQPVRIPGRAAGHAQRAAAPAGRARQGRRSRSAPGRGRHAPRPPATVPAAGRRLPVRGGVAMRS